jgi:phage major head subunit gpT-like protein
MLENTMPAAGQGYHPGSIRSTLFRGALLGHGGSSVDLLQQRMPHGVMTPGLADSTVNTGIRIGGTSPDEQKVEIAYVGFGTRLANRLQTYESFFSRLATVVDSPNLINREIWLNALPVMRMWLGPKVIERISAENTPIVTRPHEVSIAIGKGTLQNDQLGLYGQLVDKLAEAYPNALDDLVITMLCAGIQGTALGATYDGQNLIDTDHTFRSADTGIAAFQYSNKVTGAFTASVFQSAVNLYKTLKNERGIPVNVGKGQMMLVHGPANRIPVRNVLKQDIGAGLVQNLDKDTAIPVEVPWIQARTTSVLGTSVTLTGLEWFLMPVASTAVILQRKRAAELMSVEQGYQVFMDGTYYYGLEAEFGAAYGLPQEIVGGPGS